MHERLKKLLFGIAIATVLGLSFTAYLRPSFIVDLANRIVLCF